MGVLKIFNKCLLINLRKAFSATEKFVLSNLGRSSLLTEKGRST